MSAGEAPVKQAVKWLDDQLRDQRRMQPCEHLRHAAAGRIAEQRDALQPQLRHHHPCGLVHHGPVGPGPAHAQVGMRPGVVEQGDGPPVVLVLAPQPRVAAHGGFDREHVLPQTLALRVLSHQGQGVGPG